MAIYVPIVMYGLRLFIVVLQELHCLPNCLHVCVITSPSFVALYFMVFEIATNVNTLPEAVLLLFYKNYIVYQIVYMFL